jgi:hypothetical protein
MTAQCLNTIGLVLGMLGVVLIFLWGPPQPDLDESVGIALEDATVLADGTKVSDMVAAAKRRKRRHWTIPSIGLFLIFCGFGVQLWAVWTPA